MGLGEGAARTKDTGVEKSSLTGVERLEGYNFRTEMR